ncbi:hypothetical protein HN358_00150 [Candidatus Uhrbacteria bacterium]|jgi:hypothetical protein|nr:hypothetical protein [Candidatus Uhrbacteria bacterium]MBT7717260.1 hypothetical protein [Candidatus Uhrbacteria bacterium]
MKYLRKEVEYRSWHITLAIAVLFVAIVLGIVQKISGDNAVDSTAEIRMPELTEATCQNTGGEWESCGSACRGEEAQDPDVICAEVCVDHCYCRSDGECPAGHHCEEYIEETGICALDF